MVSRGSWLKVSALVLVTLGCSSSTSGGPSGGAGGQATDAAMGTATGGAPGSGGSNPGGAGGPGSGGTPGGGGGSAGTSSARELAMKLGRSGNFMIGMGNDLDNDHSKDGAYTLGVTMDLHYAYLVGLMGKFGWTDWNPGGYFVDILADAATKKGTTPMYTLYSMAASGENNVAALTDADYMQRYWAGAKILFQRLGAFDKPAAVHLEPDFWAYMQQKSMGDPTKVKVLVKMAADCAALGDDLAGMGQCLLLLSRKYAPKTLIGFHASDWAGSPEQTIAFLNALGAQSSDFVATDGLDRDAGCFEAKTDPNCQRGGTFYLDETNTTHPNFHDYLGWVRSMATGLKKPMLWWQIPFGVPSPTPGGTAGRYRDNRVHYMFGHVQEFIDAGFAGAAFGTGAQNQTYITTDGGQFKNAVTDYYAHPVPLP